MPKTVTYKLDNIESRLILDYFKALSMVYHKGGVAFCTVTMGDGMKIRVTVRREVDIPEPPTKKKATKKKAKRRAHEGIHGH